MLYKQGMIIPENPSNKCEKPLLIGSQEQVASQMEYIYRGNDGLVSKEEILAAGEYRRTNANESKIRICSDSKNRRTFGSLDPRQKTDRNQKRRDAQTDTYERFFKLSMTTRS
jgi:hypothetical protein